MLQGRGAARLAWSYNITRASKVAARQGQVAGFGGKHGPACQPKPEGEGPVPARVCRGSYGTGELLKRGGSALVSLGWDQVQSNSKFAFQREH